MIYLTLLMEIKLSSLVFLETCFKTATTSFDYWIGFYSE